MRIQEIILCLSLLLAMPAWGKVLVRWTQASVPPEKALGAPQLVVSGDSNAASMIRSAREQGYEVYMEVSLQQASAAGDAVAKQTVAGLIVDRGNAKADEVNAALSAFRSTHPKIAILFLDGNGKQPEMRGQTITTRNGILQVSSPTAQPWLDSNLAMVRFHQEFYPEQRPLYTFPWEASDSAQQASGPSAEDYELAIAEAGAIHADLILNLDEKLQKGLAENQPAAWATWNKVKEYLSFVSIESSPKLKPWANVGIITDSFDEAYEPMNLMGRHNIPYVVLRATGLDARKLEAFDVVTVFSNPGPQGIEALRAFAQQGGTAVLVNVEGNYPWHSARPEQTAEHALSYAVGKGRVIELAEPVGDPETFAQDVRRLIDKNKVLISLWNALTTVAIPYRENGETILELVNYAEEPLRVQVRLKGLFSSARYESPEQSCCQELPVIARDGFTEFVVPSLGVAGRVRLKSSTIH